uniref:Ephrin RBD domain-containing protein n=1 Tax=Angiostrongylus cantonensis TaxID=6313 RepID=A0A158P947_ANGCA
MAKPANLRKRGGYAGWAKDDFRFDISNTDHVMPVNIGDRVSLLCPRPGASNYEYSNIYAVSEEEYTHCFLQRPHLVGSCNNNTQEVSITIVFRQFTPTPGGMEFEPGRTYYFITTSDGTLSGIDRRKDGLCSDRQMKVKFEVDGHELPNANPKFAARTSQDIYSESSTPVMYIIHVDGEDSDELDGLFHESLTKQDPDQRFHAILQRRLQCFKRVMSSS